MARPLTPREKAIRRLGRANVVDTTTCPKCGAPPGTRCIAVRYQERFSPHIERIRAKSQE